MPKKAAVKKKVAVVRDTGRIPRNPVKRRTAPRMTEFKDATEAFNPEVSPHSFPESPVITPTPGVESIDPETGLAVDEYGVEMLYPVGTKRKMRKRTKEQSRLINHRIEEIRGLMSLSMCQEDIARSCAMAWSISRKSVYKYIVIARKRQNAILDRQPLELKSDSLSFWSTKLRSAVADANRAKKDLAEANEFVKQVKDNMKASRGDVHALQQYDNILKKAYRMKTLAQDAISSSESVARQIQTRIDLMVGNNAPERIALVNSKSEDVQPVESMTNGDARVEAFDMIKDLLKMLKPEDRRVIEAEVKELLPVIEQQTEVLDILIEEVEEE